MASHLQLAAEVIIDLDNQVIQIFLSDHRIKFQLLKRVDPLWEGKFILERRKNRKDWKGTEEEEKNKRGQNYSRLIVMRIVNKHRIYVILEVPSTSCRRSG